MAARTVLLVGIRSEPPLAEAAASLAEIGCPIHVIDQREFDAYDLHLADDPGQADGGHITHSGVLVGDVRDFSAIYLRLMDDQALPAVAAQPPGSPLRRKARLWHENFISWTELTPARVVNRLSAQTSNFSKPYQLETIRKRGFCVPETLITSDPALALAFWHEHRDIIYKSISAQRSIVSRFTDADLARLARIRHCPVQFQAWVPGDNVRVHVVGDKVFATLIRSEAVDYRYAKRQVGVSAELESVVLDNETTRRCLTLAHSLGLPFAGVDLKITSDGTPYCFEVNPSPAYSYYEMHTRQPISRALAEYLAA